MTILQNIILPSDDKTSVMDMYIRYKGGENENIIAHGCIKLKAEDECSFDTYFNVFAVETWQKKCEINQLGFFITGSGNFILTVNHQTNLTGATILHSETYTLSDDSALINIPNWSELDSGVIYVTIHAKSDCLITAASFNTASAPARDVKLGIVITHFDRKQYVLPAIDRLSRTLLATSDIRDKIKLVVVDNSRNITNDEML